MTFTVRNTKTGTTFPMYARGGIDHLWGLVESKYGKDGAKDHEVIGASSFGKRLWGTV